MRRTKIIPIRLVRDNTDTDWDGVPDFRDCQPLNPRKQENEKKIMNDPKRTPLPGYVQPTPVQRNQFVQQAPPGYQFYQPDRQVQQVQRFQIPSRMYDRSVVNLPAARFTFLRFI